MTSGKLSVLISCFNQRDFIAEAMTSFFEQDYENIEMIVLDDGSIDDSMDVIASVAQKAPFPVRFQTQANHGAAYTFSKLADMASGDYLLFMGGDDFVAPNSLRQRVEALEQNSDLFCASALCRHFRDGKIAEFSFAGEKILRFNDLSVSEMLDVMKRYRLTEDGMLILPATIIRRRDFIEAGGFDKDMIGDDSVLFYRIFVHAAKKKRKFIIFPEVVFFYRQHGENTCKNPEAMWLRFSELYTKLGFCSRRQASFSAYSTYMQKVRQSGKWYQKDILKRIFNDPAVIKWLTLGAICRDLFFPRFRRF